MTRIAEMIAALILGIFAIQTGFWYQLLDWVKAFVLDDLAPAIWALVPSGLASHFESIDVSEVSQYVSDITWFVPFWGVMAIYFVAISLAGLILLVRYIIGWIPTVEG